MKPAHWLAHWEILGDRVQKLKTTRFKTVIILNEDQSPAYLLFGKYMVDNPTHQECLKAVQRVGAEHTIVIQRRGDS